MKAADVMVTRVVKVLDSDTIRTVLEKLVIYRIGGLPIVNERNQIKGYISDGDIMRAIGRQETMIIDLLTYISTWADTQSMEDKFRTLIDTNVMELAGKSMITVNVETPLEDVAALLGKKRIKKVMVEKNNGYLAGIISRGDMVRYVSSRYLQKQPG